MASLNSGSSWSFAGIPNGLPLDNHEPHREIPGSFQEDEDLGPKARPAQSSPISGSGGGSPPTLRPRRNWPARTCRICLEIVQPSFEEPNSVPSFLEPRPRVSYISGDPALGRLIRPCKCRGSSRYVHEGCLQRWRHTDPSYSSRNFYKCPTCGFRYRLQRMSWGYAINNAATRVALTFAIFLVAMFILGFLADPIIGLYLDPYDTIVTHGVGLKGGSLFANGEDDSEPDGWTQHFAKGLASLGLLGFVKVFFALSPWQWWNLRSSGLLSSGARAGTTGRDRVANISWVVVVLGVLTFLWTVWKGVRNWSRRALEKASEAVMDVPLEGVGEDSEEEDTPPVN